MSVYNKQVSSVLELEIHKLAIVRNDPETGEEQFLSLLRGPAKDIQDTYYRVGETPEPIDVAKIPGVDACPLVWDFAGGRRDPGESKMETVVRETFEEIGVHVGQFHMYWNPQKYYTIPLVKGGYRLEKPTVWVTTDKTNLINLGHEHRIQGWLPAKQLLEMPMVPYLHDFLAQWQKDKHIVGEAVKIGNPEHVRQVLELQYATNLRVGQ